MLLIMQEYKVNEFKNQISIIHYYNKYKQKHKQIQNILYQALKSIEKIIHQISLKNLNEVG